MKSGIGLILAVPLVLIGLAVPAPADQVINDDLIVDGSACIGFDCVNGESFGFDTIRLKENNVRIKFDDTSSTASFPKNDWTLGANDTSNGGQERFFIEDVTGGRIPFTVEAGAPSNSLYLESSGELGLGTANPVVQLHIVDGNTPTVRLEQDGSSGFSPQTWDLAGNETNFFIRDVTNGSKLPFRIRPNAPTSSIDVAGSSGNVGIGTSSPAAKLHVENTGGDDVDDVVVADSGDIGVGITAPTRRLHLKARSTAGGERAAVRLENLAGDRVWDFEMDGSNNFQINTSDVTPGPEFVIRSVDSGATTAGDVLIEHDLVVTGSVTKGGGTFKIDHPLDPENKFLSHSFVESPEMMNVYNGNATLDKNGEAWVQLPSYFDALNGEFRYQLTALGGAAPGLHVAEEIAANRFKIAGGIADGRVSWQVTGVRQDPFAKANPVVVEEDKPEVERGYYLHPKLYGKTYRNGIQWARTQNGVAEK